MPGQDEAEKLSIGSLWISRVFTWSATEINRVAEAKGLMMGESRLNRHAVNVTVTFLHPSPPSSWYRKRTTYISNFPDNFGVTFILKTVYATIGMNPTLVALLSGNFSAYDKTI